MPDLRPTSTPSHPIPAHAPAWNRQRPSEMPSHRYRDAYARVEVPLTDREWPSRRLVEAPLWVPVDLRDGNQALPEPMDPARKRQFFELMVAMGYKEVEIGYPSASQTDFDFVRLVAESDIAPSDVTVVVFTPARRDLIERTVESIRGITNPVVIHMYVSTAPVWRDVVLGKGREDLRQLIMEAGTLLLELVGHLPNVRFEFSPEVFNLTEPDYALELCSSVTKLWDASVDRPVILNLPATVEIATPNVYADQIEYMHKNLDRRHAVILSVHPHNDRGTGIACAELAVLAGAQRVEGCIFGNGERTGNVDIATLALNLHTQGIDPMIDFSDIDEIRRTVEYCNGIDVHSRHPYVGDLVHTAFSGTHQDAIKKGLAEHRRRAEAESRAERDIEWRVPYLPIDPTDIGRTYDAVIRINSQSGKGGIAYLLETEYGIRLPRRLQVGFARRVQEQADTTGLEIDPPQLLALFESVYLTPRSDTVELVTVESASGDGIDRTHIAVRIGGIDRSGTYEGVGPVEATTKLLAEDEITVEILELHQSSITTGNDSDALTLIEYRTPSGTDWAAGRDRSVLTASVKAVLQAAQATGGDPQ